MRYLSGFDTESVGKQTKQSCWKLCEQDDIKNCK